MYTEKEELREWVRDLVENDNLTDVRQIGDEIKGAGRFVKKVVSKAFDPSRRLAKAQMLPKVKQLNYGTKQLKHGTSSKVHTLKAKKAAVMGKAWSGMQNPNVAEDVQTSVNMPSLDLHGGTRQKIGAINTAKKALKYQSKVGVLANKAEKKDLKTGYKSQYSLKNY